jgi:DNA-binding CsgD family transcriptional regulator
MPLSLLKRNDHTHPVLYSCFEESPSMGCRGSTLLDILRPQQFQTVILLALGLDSCQVADLLETNERAVNISLSDSFDRTGCRSVEVLSVRLVYEYDNNLYDERLEKALAELQSAAKRMLEKAAYTRELSASGESGQLPSSGWVM